MGPNLICDKSTIQGLSPSELNILRRYYTLNIPPVLMLEILGDLKKAEDVAACHQQVRGLADRLVPACSQVNVEFRDLVLGEMSGSNFAMAGTPVIAGGKQVMTATGQKGVVIDNKDGDDALLRWQSGNFLEAEVLLAEKWRRATKSIDLENMQRRLRKEYSERIKLKSIEAVAEFVDDLMASAAPSLLIDWFLNDAEIGSDELRCKIVEIARNSTFSLIASLPFTAYCLRTALIFHFCLAFQLVGTRSTNRVDMQYFYYVPFCSAFSSGDKLHHDLAPYVFQHQQIFISKDDLKADLSNLASWWASLTEDEKVTEKRRIGPPENTGSPTHELWKRRMKPGYRNELRLKDVIPSERAKDMMEHVCNLLKSGLPVEGSSASGNLDDSDFVAIRQEIRLDGPCICGSDLNFGMCCGRKA